MHCGAPDPGVGTVERALVAGGLVTALGVAGLLAATGPATPQEVPSRLDRSLSGLPPGTVVWNTDLLGGWLMHSHPGLSHTSDTRAEIYGPERAQAYLRVLATDPGWRADFDAFNPGAALVGDTSALAQTLAEGGWRVRGRDAGYVLLERPASG